VAGLAPSCTVACDNVQTQTGRPYDVGFSPLSVEPTFCSQEPFFVGREHCRGVQPCVPLLLCSERLHLKQKPSLEKYQVEDPDAQWVIT